MEIIELHPLEVLGIQLVVAAVVIAAITSFFSGSRSPFAGQWRQEARELEVKVRMATGAQVVEDLRSLAKVYLRLGKRWEAEQTLRRAWNICEQQSGISSPEVLLIMEDFARLMDSLHRRKEAETVRKRINEIKQGQAK